MNAGFSRGLVEPGQCLSLEFLADRVFMAYSDKNCKSLTVTMKGKAFATTTCLHELIAVVALSDSPAS